MWLSSWLFLVEWFPALLSGGECWVCPAHLTLCAGLGSGSHRLLASGRRPCAPSWWLQREVVDGGHDSVQCWQKSRSHVCTFNESRDHEEHLALGSRVVSNSFPFFFSPFIFLVSLISLQSVKVIPFFGGKKPVSTPKSLHLSQKVKKQGFPSCKSPFYHSPGPSRLDATEAALCLLSFHGSFYCPCLPPPAQPLRVVSRTSALSSQGLCTSVSIITSSRSWYCFQVKVQNLHARSILCQWQEEGGLYN